MQHESGLQNRICLHSRTYSISEQFPVSLAIEGVISLHESCEESTERLLLNKFITKMKHLNNAVEFCRDECDFRRVSVNCAGYGRRKKRHGLNFLQMNFTLPIDRYTTIIVSL